MSCSCLFDDYETLFQIKRQFSLQQQAKKIYLNRTSSPVFFIFFFFWKIFNNFRNSYSTKQMWTAASSFPRKKSCYCVCFIVANQNNCIFIRRNYVPFFFTNHALAYVKEFKNVEIKFIVNTNLSIETKKKRS